MTSENELTELTQSNFEPPEKHPKEIADDALNSLLDYLTHLEILSKTVAQQITSDVFFDQLIVLVDGIHTLTNVIGATKHTFEIRNFPPIQILEAELLSILKDLLHYQEQGHFDQMADLLMNQLPQNFQEWQNTGIPNLIRARDC
jgi:hypothetical protein